MPNFGEMTAAHFVFIPMVLLIGTVVGYVLGARAMRAQLTRAKQRMKE
jgi:uncharacterized protein YneF (UPF0154 family)